MNEKKKIIGLKKWFFSFWAVILGVFVLILFFEISLRIFAVLLPTPIVNLENNKNAPKKGSFEIFCIGDSHTYGKGAPKGFSYPDQLWRLLKKANPNLGWHVVNAARPGFNSSQALNSLKKRMQDDPGPNLVLMCAGHNNDHNLHQATVLPEEIKQKAPALQWAYIFRNSRAFRLSQITRQRIRGLIGSEGGVPDSIYDSIIEGKEEFLVDWITKDMSEANRLCKAKKSKLLLVGYAKGVPQTRKAMKRMGTKGVRYLDNNDFGLPLITTHADLMSKDAHPNAKGYARIAYRVALFLAKNDMIPVTPEQMKAVAKETGF